MLLALLVKRDSVCVLFHYNDDDYGDGDGDDDDDDEGDRDRGFKLSSSSLSPHHRHRHDYLFSIMSIGGRKSYVDIGNELQLFDFDAGAKVSGFSLSLSLSLSLLFLSILQGRDLCISKMTPCYWNWH